MPLSARIAVVGLATAALSASRTVAQPLRSQSRVDSAQVAGVVQSFHDALARGDSAAAMALLAPDAIILESGGSETRAEYRAHHLQDDIAFSKTVASTRGPLKITVQQSTAWTTGASTTRGTFNGRQINSAGVESMVLSKAAANKWTIRSIHWSSRRIAESQSSK